MESIASRIPLVVLLLCACPSSDSPPSDSTGTGSSSGGAEGSVGNPSTSATMQSPTSSASTNAASESGVATTTTMTTTGAAGETGADETAGSDSTGDPQPAVPMCTATCERPSDCGLPSPLYNQDNWACNAGECEWLGCHDNNECIFAFMNNNYECHDVGEDVDQCVATCSEANDCSRPGPLYDDNWTCSDSECEWTGCTDDAECQAALMNANYICAEEPGFDVPQCIATCNEPDDCSRPNPLYDDDNWACGDGRCEWLGCNDDEECMSGLMNGSQECVSPQ